MESTWSYLRKSSSKYWRCCIFMLHLISEYQGQNQVGGRKVWKILPCVYTLTCGLTQHTNAYIFNPFLVAENNTNGLSTKRSIKTYRTAIDIADTQVNETLLWSVSSLTHLAQMISKHFKCTNHGNCEYIYGIFSVPLEVTLNNPWMLKHYFSLVKDP